MRVSLLVSAAAATLLLTTACASETIPSGATSPAPTSSSSSPVPTTPAEPDVPGQAAEVTDVVDGDTVKVLVAATGAALTVRVLGIDTPEVYGGAECWGAEASQFAREILAGQTVGLVADDTQDDRDRYDRALRYVVLADGANYSVLAAEAGAARSYVYDTPVSEHPAISAAEQRAQEAGAGLWGQAHRVSARNTPLSPRRSPNPSRQPNRPKTARPGTTRACRRTHRMWTAPTSTGRSP